jgi:hypothetical protein
MITQHRALLKIFSEYWRGYGGIKTLLTSPFTHATLVAFSLTVGNAIKDDNEWRGLPLQILPNVLGFFIAAHGLLAIFTNTKLSDPEKRNNLRRYFRDANITFFHFGVIGIFALLLAILGNGSIHYVILQYFPEFIWPVTVVYRGFTWYVFIYSVFCALGAALGLYRVLRTSSALV